MRLLLCYSADAFGFFFLVPSYSSYSSSLHSMPLLKKGMLCFGFRLTFLARAGLPVNT